MSIISGYKPPLKQCFGGIPHFLMRCSVILSSSNSLWISSLTHGLFRSGLFYFQALGGTVPQSYLLLSSIIIPLWSENSFMSDGTEHGSFLAKVPTCKGNKMYLAVTSCSISCYQVNFTSSINTSTFLFLFHQLGLLSD